MELLPLALIVVLACACSTPLPLSVDAATMPDSTVDTAPTADASSGCPAEFFDVDAVLFDGTPVRGCLQIINVTWYTRECRNEGVYVDGQRTDLVASLGRVVEAPTEAPTFESLGETTLSVVLAVPTARCGFYTDSCAPGIRAANCCTFSTRGRNVCRWAVRRAARPGDVVELELLAPCTLGSLLPADGGVNSPGPSIELRRARVRGTVRHIELGRNISHSDSGPFIPDCGF